MQTIISGQAKFTPATKLQGASYAQVSNTTTTIVASGTNVNGIYIRHAELSCRVSATGYISVGGNYLLRCDNSSANGYANCIKDFFIPAGVALEASTNGTSSFATVWYEVL